MAQGSAPNFWEWLTSEHGGKVVAGVVAAVLFAGQRLVSAVRWRSRLAQQLTAIHVEINGLKAEVKQRARAEREQRDQLGEVEERLECRQAEHAARFESWLARVENKLDQFIQRGGGR
jgi:chromosome condensin MukBEF ATPase and DNA-binding subunit MukB